MWMTRVAVHNPVFASMVMLALTVLVGMTPLKSAPWWQESQGALWAGAALHGLKPVLPEDFGKYIP